MMKKNPEIDDHFNMRKRVRLATFSIYTGKTANGGHGYGTGFFCSADGLALTADHCVREKGTAVFDINYQGKYLQVKWLEECSSSQADIAFLRLIDRPTDLKIDYLDAGYFEAPPDRDEEVFLMGRRVVIVGYPAFSHASPSGNRYAIESRTVTGCIDAMEPIIHDSTEKEKGKGISRKIPKRLNIRFVGFGTRKPEGGISGAPIFDCELEKVIGVQGSWLRDGSGIRGSLFGWLGADNFHATNCSSFCNLSPLLQRPAGRLCALAKEEGTGDPFVLRLGLQFFSSTRTTGEVDPDPAGLGSIANEAVLWTTNELFQRLHGKLKEILKEKYQGAGKEYNSARYTVSHERKVTSTSRPVIFATMVLAHLAKILQDMLKYDHELPLLFPPADVLCATGFLKDSVTVSGAAGLEEAIAVLRIQKDGPGLVLHGPQQAIPEPKPAGMAFRKVATPEEMLEAFLQHFLDLVKTEIENRISLGFEAMLTSLAFLEESRRYVEAACSRNTTDLIASSEDVWFHNALKEFLEKRLENFKAMKQMGKPLPTISDFEQEMDLHLDREELKHAGLEPEEALLQEAIDRILPELPVEMEKRDRLFRKCVFFTHPDTSSPLADRPGQKDEKELQEWFCILSKHRNDLWWLESFEAVHTPFEEMPDEGSAFKKVSAFFDRLQELQKTKGQLEEKIKKLTQGIAGLKQEQQICDSERERYQIAIAVLKDDIDTARRSIFELLQGKEESMPMTILH